MFTLLTIDMLQSAKTKVTQGCWLSVADASQPYLDCYGLALVIHTDTDTLALQQWHTHPIETGESMYILYNDSNVNQSGHNQVSIIGSGPDVTDADRDIDGCVRSGGSLTLCGRPTADWPYRWWWRRWRSHCNQFNPFSGTNHISILQYINIE